MFESISRRGFLGLVPAVPFAFRPPSPGLRRARQSPPSSSPSSAAPSASFPAHEPDVVKEIVSVSHGNLARVKELVSVRPALARASWDWGYGDWETPIDAASHVGNRPIAEYLIANGARPTIFTAVMLGQLDIVKQMIAASPGLQRMRGPHGITFMGHARAGGAAAAEVLKHLESLGDADPRYTDLPLTDAEQASIVGEYAFGPASGERLTVAKNARGVLTITRAGGSERNLFHHGGLVFNPPGAEAVRIRFELSGGRSSSVTVEDGTSRVAASRA
jgi:hypothetical protein